MKSIIVLNNKDCNLVFGGKQKLYRLDLDSPCWTDFPLSEICESEDLTAEEKELCKNTRIRGGTYCYKVIPDTCVEVKMSYYTTALAGFALGALISRLCC